VAGDERRRLLAHYASAFGRNDITLKIP